jgi:hypothetical protein
VNETYHYGAGDTGNVQEKPFLSNCRELASVCFRKERKAARPKTGRPLQNHLPTGDIVFAGVSHAVFSGTEWRRLAEIDVTFGNLNQD